MIYAMSDIHGCLDALKEKMKLVDLSGKNRIIFLGDYIGYGPKSGQVLKFLFDIQKKHGADKVIILKGNHEDMLLRWIDEFSDRKRSLDDGLSFDLWLKNDSEVGYNTFKTLVTKEQLNELSAFEKKASFSEINKKAAKMLIETNGELIDWLRSLDIFYATDTQIFVHAGVDEEAEDFWEWGTSEETFLWKYPASEGYFYKTVIAGHIGTSGLAGDDDFHDIYHDGESHYFIDGTVNNGGKLLLLGYDETSEKYYQIEENEKILI
ncbi:MAG: metallophosphoesterase [Lachnospiraceae bacterium]|nr:metallophosphoesterase [Lachnospiraceae bacterium]